MINYETQIMESLSGDTPEEKYKSLIAMESQIVTLIGKITVANIGYKALCDTPSDATIGNLKSFLEAYYSITKI